MTRRRLKRFFSIALIAIFPVAGWMSGAAVASGPAGNEIRPPAGQMCPVGSYVTGFDSGGNIVCSRPGVNGTARAVESRGDVDTGPGEVGSAADQAAGEPGGGPEAAVAADTMESRHAELAPSSVPTITDLDPSSVVWGTSEITIIITGSGFRPETMVVFEGSAYKPAVNQAGDELQVAIPTGDLNIGRYTVTVSNGPGLEARKKRALTVY